MPLSREKALEVLGTAERLCSAADVSAAVARLKDGFLGGRVDAATNLLSIMGIELWCRALDAAPTAGGREVLQPGLG